MYWKNPFQKASLNACLSLDVAYRLAEVTPDSAIDVIKQAYKYETLVYYGSDNWDGNDDPIDEEIDRENKAVAIASQRLLHPYLVIFAETRHLQRLSFGN